MRVSASLLTLGGLALAVWATPGGAQTRHDLPCNAQCRAWMGGDYAEDFSDDAALYSPEGDPAEIHRLRTAERGEEARPEWRHRRGRAHVARREHKDTHRQPIEVRNAPPQPEIQHRPPAEPPQATAAAAPGRPGSEASVSPKATDAPRDAKVDTGPATVTLDADRRTLTLSLATTPSQQIRLTTAQAEGLLNAMGAARQQMQPQPQPNWAYGQPVATIVDPRWTTEAERHKRDTLLHIRDPRFGWLHYSIPRATAQQLAILIKKQATVATRRQARAETP